MTGRELLEKWGLPDLTGNGRFVSANVMDSLGNGLVLAFTVLYFTTTTSLPLGSIGAALSLGQLLALPTPVVAGALIDRFGSRTVVIGANLMSAAGFCAFLAADAVWKIVAVQFVVQAGSSIYWTSSRSLVLLAARRRDHARWFGFISALRNIGGGFGAAVASLAIAWGSEWVRALVLANALSFVVAACLLAGWRPTAPTPAHAPAPGAARPAGGGGYGAVLRDLRYLRLVVANLAYVLAASVLPVLLALYITEVLHAPAWLVGACMVGNMVLVALVQTLVARMIERRRPARVLALAGVVNAAAFALFGLVLAVPGWLVAGGMLLAMAVFTVAEMLSMPSSSELSASLAPDHIRGRCLGVFQLSWSLGNALAPAVLTTLLGHGPAWPWVFLGAVNLLAVPLVLSLGDSALGEPAPADAAPEDDVPRRQPLTDTADHR
ncbi:MFS transporter [Streptomyces sp. CAI-121]|uniref:MFS transporter n=1 Tax=unclassified Streptomyces TaxID=2593676 RepID=UPI001587E376|nr:MULTISPECIES: MFS transporter [unclassified Streptomyces]NUV66535.1 MFS transporter [Streptomyces sp. CAI-121]NUW11783.1 MFS transporter [Streptomyces sp. CAI-68]